MSGGQSESAKVQQLTNGCKSALLQFYCSGAALCAGGAMPVRGRATVGVRTVLGGHFFGRCFALPPCHFPLFCLSCDNWCLFCGAVLCACLVCGAGPALVDACDLCIPYRSTRVRQSRLYKVIEVGLAPHVCFSLVRLRNCLCSYCRSACLACLFGLLVWLV